MNNILMDYVCEELEDVEKEGLKAANIDSTDKLVNIKKNLMKIEKMEGEMDGYSEDDGMYAGRGSYAMEGDSNGSYARGGRRGSTYVGGYYRRSNAGGRGGYSSMRDSRGRYSRAESKDMMIEQLGEMMHEANAKEREVLKKAMQQLETV